MVSKRNRYVSESTTDEDMDYLSNNQLPKPRKPTRVPKCFSKNALLARENRLKKKMYVDSLEQQVTTLKNENKLLNQSVDDQSFTIKELKKEVKYLKSILANSESISKLMRSINASTGMAVSSSINKKQTSNNVSIAEKTVSDNMHFQKKQENLLPNIGFDFHRHPWEEVKPYATYPTPESTTSCLDSPNFQELENELLLDMNMPLTMDNHDLFDIVDKKVESPIMDEHNYHSFLKEETEEEDVGICLHVSKNKVSLEFCPSCSDNALGGAAS